MAYDRTRIRAKNPSRGVYRTLDGRFEIRAVEKAGHWDVFRLVDGGAQRIDAAVKGYDRALDRVLEEDGVTLETLNTPATAKPEVQGEPESDRRSVVTGPAPKAPAKGRPHVNRGGRKIA